MTLPNSPLPFATPYAAATPTTVESLLKPATALHAAGDIGKARGLYQHILTAVPEHAEARLLQGHLPEAIATCRDYLVLQPGHAHALGHLAIALDEIGERDAAARLLNFDRFIRPDQIVEDETEEGLTQLNADLCTEGRLSGTYYVNVPDAVRHGNGDAGHLLFGKPPGRMPLTAERRIMTARPQNGLTVMFPSYVFHQTIPFASDQPRITISYDLRPAD